MADYEPPVVGDPRRPFIIVSGCSGGGKSTLLAELAHRGYATVDEAGRQIVKEQLAIGGHALPWDDGGRFLELLMSRTMFQFNSRRGHAGPVFFDRGLVEAAAHFQRVGKPVPADVHSAVSLYRFQRRVFMTPPWPEIFHGDGERRHSFDAAVAEYESLVPAYEAYGYEVVVLPKASVSERADWVLENSHSTGR